jgi:hypothetical protein
MAQASSKKPRKRAISRGTATGAPTERPPIPDPLGDDERVAPSGRLTSEAPGHEGLLRSGATPLPDGGVEEHPTHDHGRADDLQPDDYETQFEQAANTGFEPREDEGGEDVTVRRRRSTE